MTQKDDGGPAFPIVDNEYLGCHPGMSLRDYFAVRATEEDIDRFREWHGKGGGPSTNPGNYTYTYEEARYRFADAMLAARGTTNDPA